MPKRTKSGGLRDAKAANRALMRLLAVLDGSDSRLPAKMLKEIEAISIEGADPDWQISELQKILDRWATQH